MLINRFIPAIQNRDASGLNLGIRDCAEPIPAHIDAGLMNGDRGLKAIKRCSGCELNQGIAELGERNSAANQEESARTDEVLVINGVKYDYCQLQQVFNSDFTVSAQGQ